GDPETGE
nr:Chain P, GLY-ASP-PRO-GLU-THR-GLY-GLU [Homo sapiens]